MPTVNNVEHLRKWLRGCPALLPENHFRVDYLAEEPVEYSLISVPSTIVYRKNVLGEEIPRKEQTMQFIFATRQEWGADELQNIANFGFYQDVIMWMIEQNAIRNLPRINEGRVTAIKPTLSQYVSAPGTDSARYQIQIEVSYEMTL